MPVDAIPTRKRQLLSRAEIYKLFLYDAVVLLFFKLYCHVELPR